MSIQKKRRGFGTYLRYQMIRLHRLAAHPHDIALGVAWGVFISFTPLLGFHLILATLLCIIFGGSKVASWIGTIIGNPATFPIFFWTDYQIGAWLLRMNRDGDLSIFDAEWESIEMFFQQIWPIYAPTMLGGILLGGVVGAGFYYATYQFVDLSRRRRKRRIMAARERNLQEMALDEAATLKQEQRLLGKRR